MDLDKLKEIRIERGLTQGDMAKKVYVYPSPTGRADTVTMYTVN